MRKLSGRIKALGAFFVVAVALAACGSGVPGNSVATVAGNPITLQAFNHWLFVLVKSQAAQNPGAPVIVPDPPNFNSCVAQVRKQVPSYAKTPAKQIRAACKQDYASLTSQVMQFLILQYWYQLEGNREHVKVTNAQVQRAFNAQKRQQFSTNAQFQAFLSQTGETLHDIMFRFRVGQIVNKLIAKQTKKITPSTIQQYYKSHPTQFGTAETRNVEIVLTKSASQANAAKHALQSGQSWKKVAQRYSVDPTTKNTGGLLVGIKAGQVDSALSKAAFAAPLNKLLGPVKGQFGYYVFEVTKITAASQQSLAQATPTIRQALSSKQQSSAQAALAKLLRQHWLGKTDCRSGYNATSQCNGYKPPKTTSTPTTTAPSK